MTTVWTPQSSKVRASYPRNLAQNVRNTLRRLGLFHAYERKDKLYTFDLPFQLLASRDGRMVAVVINKDSIPRAYSHAKILSAQKLIERQIGFPTQIQETKDRIAICLDTNSQV